MIVGIETMRAPRAEPAPEAAPFPGTIRAFRDAKAVLEDDEERNSRLRAGALKEAGFTDLDDEEAAAVTDAEREVDAAAAIL